MRQSIKSGLSKFCVKQPLKYNRGYLQTISLQIFKGFFPQNLLSSLLNTLSHIHVIYTV